MLREIFGVCADVQTQDKFKVVLIRFQLSTTSTQKSKRISLQEKEAFLASRSSQQLKKASKSRLFIALHVQTSIQIPPHFSASEKTVKRWKVQQKSENLNGKFQSLLLMAEMN
jgi:hypothetical protein